MFSLKDKQLRKELLNAGIIKQPFSNKNYIEVDQVVDRSKLCFDIICALADHLGVELHENKQQNPNKYVFIKKGSAEARKLKKKKAAGPVSWDEAVFPWKI